MVVLPNVTHDLVDGFVLFADHNSKIRGVEVAVVRSSDHGSTWSKKPIIVAPLDRAFPGPVDPDNGRPIRGGELPDFAVDPHNGNVYAVWDDDLLTGIDAITFSQSTDGGFTWSTPVKINQTPTSIPPVNQQAFTPTVKVAANGTVGVTYYDLRSNTAAPGLPTDYWLVRCAASCTNSTSWAETHVAGPFDTGAGVLRRRLLPGRLRRDDDERQRLPALLRAGRQSRRRQSERRLLRDGALTGACLDGARFETGPVAGAT